MKNGIFNPSSFLPPDVVEWAGEKGCSLLEGIDNFSGSDLDQYCLSFQDSMSLPGILGHSAEVESLGVFDGVKRIDGKLWPQIFLKSDLQAIIAKRKWMLERSRPCFLWGSDFTLRWMLSFALQMGFKEVVVFHEETAWSKPFIRPGTEIYWMSEDKISEMSFEGNFFMVHFEKVKAPRQFQDAIKYMHFLSEGAYFIDVSQEPQLESEFLSSENRLVGIDAWKEILSFRLSI